MTSAELLQQQLSASRKKPKGVKPDVSNGVQYNAELQRIVRAVRKDINEHVMPVVRSTAPQYVGDSIPVETIDNWVDVLTGTLDAIKSRWSSLAFQRLAADIASRFVRAANESNMKRTQCDLGINIYSDSQELTDYITLSIRDNTRLIMSIPDQYLTQVESIVLTNVRAGGRPSAIAKSLQQQFGVTERRAKMIARDQTAKVNGDLNRMRQTNAGFPYFEWNDSDDERVRDRHEYLADHVTAYGKGIYRWDNPPLSDKGVPIIPGTDYQCRCVARPVGQEEVDANIKAGRVAKGVLR